MLYEYDPSNGNIVIQYYTDTVKAINLYRRRNEVRNGNAAISLYFSPNESATATCLNLEILAISSHLPIDNFHQDIQQYFTNYPLNVANLISPNIQNNANTGLKGRISYGSLDEEIDGNKLDNLSFFPENN